MTTKGKAKHFLEGINQGTLTLGQYLCAYRISEEITQTQLAETLGVSVQYLCDIEKGRKQVSPEKSALFAEALGDIPEYFVMLVLRERLDQLGYYDININYNPSSNSKRKKFG